MSNNQFRKPVLTSTEEFVISQGIFKRIITLYRRVLRINGSIILNDEKLLQDELFVHALGTKFGQEFFKGYIDFNDKKVAFEINLDVFDEDGKKVEFYKLGTQTKNYIFDRLIDAPKCCNLKFNDFGRGHKYVFNGETYEHSRDIESSLGSDKFEQLGTELTELAKIFDSCNYD